MLYARKMNKTIVFPLFLWPSWVVSIYNTKICLFVCPFVTAQDITGSNSNAYEGHVAASLYFATVLGEHKRTECLTFLEELRSMARRLCLEQYEHQNIIVIKASRGKIYFRYCLRLP